MGSEASSVIVLYDGVCGFCDQAVTWLLLVDRQHRLRFAPLQGSTAAAIRRRHPELPANLDSIVVIETSAAGERLSWHSTAALRVADLVGIHSVWVRLAKLCPRPLADLGYRAFARARYRLFGKLTECRVPSAAERALFLP